MGKFSYGQISHSSERLGRVIDDYGFTSKLMLTKYFDMASSSLAGRYNRGGFPTDMVVRYVAETGASLEWLATGQGRKFDDEELDILIVPHRKIVDGIPYEAGMYMLNKLSSLPGIPLRKSPTCVFKGNNQFIIDTSFTEVYDDQWLVGVEGKTSIRTPNRIPIKNKNQWCKNGIRLFI